MLLEHVGHIFLGPLLVSVSHLIQMWFRVWHLLYLVGLPTCRRFHRLFLRLKIRGTDYRAEIKWHHATAVMEFLFSHRKIAAQLLSLSEHSTLLRYSETRRCEDDIANPWLAHSVRLSFSRVPLPFRGSPRVDSLACGFRWIAGCV